MKNESHPPLTEIDEEIVDKLSSGINPIDGVPFDADHITNQPIVLRTLMNVHNFLRDDRITKSKLPFLPKTTEQRRQENINRGLPEYHHFVWNEEQVMVMEQLFKSGYSFDQIAEKIGRSKHSIRAKLRDIGLIEGFGGNAL